MVGRDPRGCCAVDAGRGEVQARPERDPVKGAKRPRGGKAPARRMEPEPRAEGRRAAARRPVVEIAKDRRRHLLAPAQRRADRGQLHRAVATDQAEMHADDPETAGRLRDLGQNRAARLQPRQHEAANPGDRQALAHEDRLAMPAQARAIRCEGQDAEIGLALDQRAGQGGGARRQPAIDLLQGDDVGAKRVDDLDHPFGDAKPVEADAFVHVVGGEAEGHAADLNAPGAGLKHRMRRHSFAP
ncbi:MAG: hypothetical protein B7Z02_14670 [Rhodobacterales bacterium 32-67-9]|nr:MAG: hypothetical protein B7Z02_14670 [Rhodobacterales bacterium 32-67-9]